MLMVCVRDGEEECGWEWRGGLLGLSSHPQEKFVREAVCVVRGSVCLVCESCEGGRLYWAVQTCCRWERVQRHIRDLPLLSHFARPQRFPP